MLQRLNRIYRKTIGISEKEFKLKLRFPIYFFTRTLIKPFVSIIPFVILYAGIFFTQNPNIFSLINIYLAYQYEPNSVIYYYYLYEFIEANFLSSFNQSNYLSWLLIGNVVFVFSRNGFNAFIERFQLEKFWNTIQGIILAPVNRYILLFGFILITLFESLLFFILLIIISYLIVPVSFIQIIFVFLIACLMIIASAGIGLMKGAVFISTESYRAIFELIQFIILFLSCYSIPFEFFPDFLQPIIFLNPFYHGVSLAQNVYFGIYSPNIIFSIVYIVIFSIVMVFLGVFLFNNIWKKYGIHGY